MLTRLEHLVEIGALGLSCHELSCHELGVLRGKHFEVPVNITAVAKLNLQLAPAGS